MQASKILIKNRSPYLRKIFLGFSVLLALIFSFSTYSFAGESNSNHSDESTVGESTSIQLPDNLSFSENPFDSNLPDPDPAEPEEAEEEEKPEKEDTSEKACKAIGKATEFCIGNLEKDQGVRFSQSLQHRKSIPFFILFHSWKSFLS
jgi:hypothetical protein